MADCKFSLSEIKELMEKLASTNLGELSLKVDDFELKIKAKAPAPVAAPPAASTAAVAAASTVVTTELPAAPAAEEKPVGNVVKSPIVGTFYAAPAPDKDPYVTVGSKVKKGDILFVIESMKLMNEIASDFDGEVAEILVENAQGVEYNQPILVIR